MLTLPPGNVDLPPGFVDLYREICRPKKIFCFLRICFKIILSLAERCLGIDLRCEGAVNSGLFTSLERVKIPQRASDKPKKQIQTHISDNLKTDSNIRPPFACKKNSSHLQKNIFAPAKNNFTLATKQPSSSFIFHRPRRRQTHNTQLSNCALLAVVLSAHYHDLCSGHIVCIFAYNAYNE